MGGLPSFSKVEGHFWATFGADVKRPEKTGVLLKASERREVTILSIA